MYNPSLKSLDWNEARDKMLKDDPELAQEYRKLLATDAWSAIDVIRHYADPRRWKLSSPAIGDADLYVPLEEDDESITHGHDVARRWLKDNDISIRSDAPRSVTGLPPKE